MPKSKRGTGARNVRATRQNQTPGGRPERPGQSGHGGRGGSGGSWGAYDSDTLTRSPWLYWKLDDTTTTAADSSGNSRTGTYGAGVTPLHSRTELAAASADFQNATDSLVTGPSMTWTSLTACTLEAFVHLDAIHPSSPFISSILGHPQESGVNTRGMFMRFGGAGGNAIEAFIGNGTSFYGTPQFAATVPGWWYVVAVWTGSVIRLYVNASQVGSDAATPASISGVGAVYAGNSDEGHTRPLNGTITRAALYTTALSGATISSRYALAPTSQFS